MKDLNLKRAIGFSVLFYIVSFILFALMSVVFGTSIDTKPNEIPLLQCIVYLLSLIPAILVCAKWYFRKFQPSTQRGVLLGIVALIVSCVFDLVLVTTSMPDGGGIEMLGSLYTDWKFFATIVILVGTSAYAGFEFDRTYTFEEGALRKKN
ncbi:MAG TPA: hypothetical protein PK295_03565 [Candidatus Magasanikbacteria bacterium]|nr:hypothetical protein [Candidatus Magasanikbacteria bacterium]